ncbi:type I restriction modification DNA specificity domain protein, partial [Capnocytophaga ochracea str. Holt 25]|uniref:restriction endonuclease subunit S n=1 Tax=Capnocytophaga ochracea TaxID=1018 RepID=UPI00026F275D
YYEKFTLSGEVKCIDEEIPFEIPNGWEWCRLGLIGDWGAGATPLRGNIEYYGGKIPWLKTGELNNGLIISTEEYITDKALEECSLRLCNVGDILIAMYGATIGKLGIAGIKLTTNQACCACTPIFIYNKFLFYFLMANKQSFIEQGEGGAQPNISRIKLVNYLFPLPPLKEQQHIVEKIEELIPHIEHHGKAQAELNTLNKNIKEQLKKSVLQYAIEGKLVPQDETEGTAEVLLEQIQKEKLKLYEENKLKKKDLEHSTIFKGEDNKYYEKIGKNVTCIDEEIPFEIPKDWRWVRMGQIGDWGAGSTPPRSNPNYYNGKILWLKTGELNNGIVFDTEEKITEKAFQECSLRINKVGNVLIAMYGATIGKLAIADKELTTNQACCGCSPYLINNWYLFYFLMASREQFIKRGEGGAQPNISRVKLVEHLIPLPPLYEQQRIVNTIQNIFRCIEKN